MEGIGDMYAQERMVNAMVSLVKISAHSNRRWSYLHLHQPMERRGKSILDRVSRKK